MAKWNEEYYQGEDHYSDGEIEEEILNMVKQGRGIDSMEGDKMSYPVMYHMSKVRENILLWYPFQENAKVLEVGAGCGAITGMLCEKVKQVTAVDLSKRRALVNYERNKQYENLEIWVGNLNDMPVKAEFDYIILNGVFEYAGSFTEGEKPYEKFLAALSERLTPGGYILIAIENRLGAKYFAGAPEEHTDRYFLGLNQYEHVDTVKTFTKAEMQELCNSVGLVCNRFYYPYPDYKFPYEIFTDDTINTTMYGRPIFQFHEKRLAFFSEPGLCQTLAKERVADRFANSFLVEVTKERIQPKRDIKYVKLNTDRNPQFRIFTVIWEEQGRKYVGKYPVGSAAQEHLANMQAAKAPGNVDWYYLEGKNQQGAVVYPYLEASTLDDAVSNLLCRGEREWIKGLIKGFYQEFLTGSQEMEDYQGEEFQQVFGTERCTGAKKCCKDLDIDLIFDNIFCLDGQYAVIDTEWIFPFYIPVEYVMWRVLNELYYKHSLLEHLIARRELEDAYGITVEDAMVFKQWEIHFAYRYVGSYGLQKYEKQPFRLELEKIVRYYERERYLDSKLYLNTGNGYSEKETILSREVLEDGHFLISIRIPAGIKLMSLRWDPADFACRCRIKRIFSNDQELSCIPQNHVSSEEETDLFLTNDPRYEISGGLEQLSELVIEGNISFLTPEEIVEEAERIIMYKKENEDKNNLMKRIRNRFDR